jgi:hypothetical protein
MILTMSYAALLVSPRTGYQLEHSRYQLLLMALAYTAEHSEREQHSNKEKENAIV